MLLGGYTPLTKRHGKWSVGLYQFLLSRGLNPGAILQRPTFIFLPPIVMDPLSYVEF